MPAPAVIPAPIAYIKVVAVKKLVVGIGEGRAWSADQKACTGPSPPMLGCLCLLLNEWAVRLQAVYFE